MNQRLLLPKSSLNEELETLSRRKLEMLLGSSKFEVRQETIRDKGVDLIIELKETGSYTNFRFIVQLKATNSISKTGKTISHPLEVSNINYLLNYGMPAFYVLYHNRSDQFYVANVKEVFDSLIKKYRNSTLPQKYHYRFVNTLSENVIDKIYKDTLTSGRFLRKLNSHIPLTTDPQIGLSIMIDEENDVYSAAQNIDFIEQCGFRLLNELQFQRIIEIEQRTYLGNTEASAMLHYVCGMAYFHKTQLFRAIDYLKKAERQINSFEPDQQAILGHILLQNKYLLGMIDKESYEEENRRLLTKDDIGSFLEIEKACQAFYQAKDNYTERLSMLYDRVEEIFNRDPENEGARLVGYGKIFGIEMNILTHELGKNLANLFWFGGSYLKNRLYEKWEAIEKQYFDRVGRLVEYGGNKNDMLAFSNLTFHHLEWAYRSAYIRQFFDNWDHQARTAGKVRDEASVTVLIKKSGILERVFEFLHEISHVETQIFCMSLKYKIEDFTGQMETASITLERIKRLIDENDLQAVHVQNYQKLLDGYTDHEVFYRDTQARMTHFYQVVDNSKIDLTLINNPPADSLDAFDKYLEWSVTTFRELDLSNSKAD